MALTKPKDCKIEQRQLPLISVRKKCTCWKIRVEGNSREGNLSRFLSRHEEKTSRKTKNGTYQRQISRLDRFSSVRIVSKVLDSSNSGFLLFDVCTLSLSFYFSPTIYVARRYDEKKFPDDRTALRSLRWVSAWFEHVVTNKREIQGVIFLTLTKNKISENLRVNVKSQRKQNNHFSPWHLYIKDPKQWVDRSLWRSS